MSATVKKGTGRISHKDVVLGHGAECDGIEEYDNALPAWWLGIFYVTVLWGVGYAIHFHFIGHRSQAGAYAAEMAAAEARWPQPTVAGVDLSPSAVAEGEKIYQTNCIACHGATLQGGIGPNLTDGTWIHGNQPEDILRTVTEGVGTKGMPAWGKVLGPVKAAQVAAFVYKKQGPTPEGG